MAEQTKQIPLAALRFAAATTAKASRCVSKAGERSDCRRDLPGRFVVVSYDFGRFFVCSSASTCCEDHRSETAQLYSSAFSAAADQGSDGPQARALRQQPHRSIAHGDDRNARVEGVYFER